MEGHAYSAKLKCCFNGLRALEDGEIVLDLPFGEACSMDGAIEIAEQIMPNVWRVLVRSEGRQLIEYRLKLGRWEAYDE